MLRSEPQKREYTSVGADLDWSEMKWFLTGWTKILLSAGFRNVPRTTEPGVKNFRRVPFFGVTLLGHARKVTRNAWV